MGTKKTSADDMAVKTKEEAEEQFSMEGKRSKDMGAAFACKECGKQYKFVKALQNHMKKHNPSTVSNLDCLQCNFEASTSADLGEHMISVHGTKQEALDPDGTAESLDLGVAVQLPCNYCEKTFSRRDKVNAHVKKAHGDEEVKDTLDEFSGPASEDVEDMSVAMRIPCAYCENTFSRKDKVNAHVRKVHADYNLEGSLDESSDPGAEASDNLLEEKTFSCDSCPKAFKKSKHLNRHRSSVHSNVIISCDHCGKHFSRRDKLNVHMKNVH